MLTDVRLRQLREHWQQLLLTYKEKPQWHWTTKLIQNEVGWALEVLEELERVKRGELQRGWSDIPNYDPDPCDEWHID